MGPSSHSTGPQGAAVPACWGSARGAGGSCPPAVALLASLQGFGNLCKVLQEKERKGECCQGSAGLSGRHREVEQGPLGALLGRLAQAEGSAGDPRCFFLLVLLSFCTILLSLLFSAAVPCPSPLLRQASEILEGRRASKPSLGLG